MANGLTDLEVRAEIERLRKSEFVKLAKKEEQIRCRERQYLYQLRSYEKKGKALAAAGVTMDLLTSAYTEDFYNEE